MAAVALIAGAGVGSARPARRRFHRSAEVRLGVQPTAVAISPGARPLSTSLKSTNTVVENALLGLVPIAILGFAHCLGSSSNSGWADFSVVA